MGDAAQLVANLGGGPAERASAFDELDKLVAHREEDGSEDGAGRADVAVACTSALCAVMCRDASEVDLAEYQRAALMIGALTALDRARVAGETIKMGQPNWFALSKSSSSVFGAALKKDPEHLTQEDVLAMVCVDHVHCVPWVKGLDLVAAHAGLTGDEVVTEAVSAMFLAPGGGLSLEDDSRCLAVSSHVVDMLRDPAHKPIRDFTNGAWMLINHTVLARPAVAQHLLENGLLELAVQTLDREEGPQQWVSATSFWQQGFPGWVMQAMAHVLMGASTAGTDVTTLLVSSGYADMLVAALKAAEQIGADEACDCVVVAGALWTLEKIDSGHCLPQIEEKVRGAEGALRFCMDSGLAHTTDLGLTAGVHGSILAANVFGKEESGGFEFKQQDIEGLVSVYTEVITPTAWGVLMQPGPKELRGLLHIAISDRNKVQLIRCSGFIPLLVTALLLAPDHPRKDMDVDLKASIQRDASECVLQCCLYPPGREALRASSALCDALAILVDKGLTDEARDCARRSLAIFNPEPQVATQQVDMHRHLMMSYSWEQAGIVRRIAAELKCRGYRVWIDVESMKGNVVDSMSEAIEAADIILYGVSLAYKESANCRLELSYGMESKVPMTPLMLQKGYKAR